MTLPTLSINKTDLLNIRGVLGMTEFLSYLRDSNKFNITYHDESIDISRGQAATILYYNQKKIYLDLWDYALPTYSTQVVNGGFDIIIKLQHKKVTMEEFLGCRAKKKMLLNIDEKTLEQFMSKIVPWTFFGSRMMAQFVGKEHLIPKQEPKQLAFFCGKWWKCRKGLKAALMKQGIEYITSSQEDLVAGRPLSDQEYLDKMMTSKYGLVLHGRGSHFTQAKNRREIDYMMLGKPLLLNYKPFYYNEMVEGKHYIYINEKTNLKNLENVYNIEEIAKNGHKWYQENASPEGIVNTFLQIINKE